MATLLALLFGMVVGATVVWVALARKHVKEAAFAELDKPIRREMRQIMRGEFPTFRALISNISPKFCEIYDQASDAESLQLDQVSGIAYGRALEFLVRDYAKHLHPGAAEQIEKVRLVDCIKNFISDAAIRDSADLARGCRNEETHYTRRYETRDVKDLKRLVKLMISLIENSDARRALELEAQTEKSAVEMLERKKASSGRDARS